MIQEKIPVSTRMCVVIAILVFGVSCAPLPIERVVYPSISGTLIHNKRPGSGYEVHFSYTINDACNESDGKNYQFVVTNQEGKFLINEKKSWSMFRMAVPAATYAHFNLCVVDPEGDKKWFFASDLRTVDWAAPMNLECNFDQMLGKPAQLDGKLSFDKISCQINGPYSQS